MGLSFCVWIYVFTSHGGGALRYEGTILKVTEPLASLWNTSHEKSLAFYLSCLQRAALKGEMPLLKWILKTAYVCLEAHLLAKYCL